MKTLFLSLFLVGAASLADSIPGDLKPLDAYDPIEMTSRNDTLSVVFASDSLFYPFGKHPEIQAFKNGTLCGITIKSDYVWER